MTTKKPFDADAVIKEHGEEIEKLNRYEGIHEAKLQKMDGKINKAIAAREGMKARYIFVWATIVGIGGAICVNRMLELDGGWTYLSTLAVTLTGGAVFAALSAAWLGAYTSMGE